MNNKRFIDHFYLLRNVMSKMIVIKHLTHWIQKQRDKNWINIGIPKHNNNNNLNYWQVTQ